MLTEFRIKRFAIIRKDNDSKFFKTLGFYLLIFRSKLFFFYILN